MFYKAIKPVLFKLDAERAHDFTLQALKKCHKLGLLKASHAKAKPKTVMGLDFPNMIGLAAGLDKNGDYIDCLAALGFGFIEIGTVTPKPQDGNPKPRLFRVPQAKAIINRMGFNNKGIDYLIEQVKQAKYSGILGINIGKNALTPLENAIDDYKIGLTKAYPYASYITVNISSPNTANLRQLQHGEFLEALLGELKAIQSELEQRHYKKVPLLIKVAPDLSHEQIIQLADAFIRHKVDGVIISNTTISREGIEHLAISKEAGGLSGAPLTEKSTEILRMFHRELKTKIPLIAAGGIMSPEHAQQKLQAGAQLVQLYSGLIYQGPSLIKSIIKSTS